MSWFRSERGDGFWRGLWRRPSTWFLLLSIVLFGLQMFTLTGVFLMFFGGALINGTLVVLFVLSVTVEALRGYLPRAWLALPVAALVGYYAAALPQRADVEAQRLALIAHDLPAMTHEEGQQVLFDTSEAPWDQRDSVGAHLLAYDLAEAFMAVRGGGISRMEIVLPDTPCAPPATMWTSSTTSFRQLPYGTGPVRFCLTERVTLSAAPLRIVHQRKYAQPHTNETAIEHFILFRGDEELGRFSSTRRQMMGLLPFPLFAGCLLISGGPDAGWKCSTHAVLEHVVIDSAPAGYEGYLPAAVLLGLKPRSAADLEAFMADR